MSGARILIIDDSEDDVLLAAAQIRRTLRDARFCRVDNAVQLRAALAHAQWDIVLCDHNMPAFDSTAALGVVRMTCPQLPFYVYSGEFSRAQSAAVLQAGAQGVLEKRDTAGLTRVITSATACEGTAS